MKKESVNYKCKHILILELFFNGKDGFGGHRGDHDLLWVWVWNQQVLCSKCFFACWVTNTHGQSQFPQYTNLEKLVKVTWRLGYFTTVFNIWQIVYWIQQCLFYYYEGVLKCKLVYLPSVSPYIFIPSQWTLFEQNTTQD